jgi:hypothetical protein
MVVFFLGKLCFLFDAIQSLNAGGATTAPVLCCEIRARQQRLIYIFSAAE